MAASNKPNPAPSKKSATSGGAAATKVPAKGAARKSTASSKPAATKARATKATTTPMKNTAATTPAPTKSTATKATAKKATAKKAPARSATATKATAAATPTKAAGTSTTAVKAAPRRVPKPPSPDTPSILSNYRPDRHEIPAARGTSKDGITYTKDFDVKFLKAQHDALISERVALTGQATRLEDEANSLIEDGEMGDVQFDDESGEGDTMVVERERDLALSAQARQTVVEIDAALERMANGTYGYSIVSGAPIPRERLEAIPWATVLVEEKVGGIGRR